MSSALAMVLMTAMAVPGNGPEKVSWEMEQELDLGGKWEGIGLTTGEIWWAEVSNRALVMRCVFGKSASPDKKALGLDRWELGEIMERGKGKLLIAKNYHQRGQELQFGIYKWDGDRLIICFRIPEYGRPKSFQPSEMQWLLVLHRVKPRK